MVRAETAPGVRREPIPTDVVGAADAAHAANAANVPDAALVKYVFICTARQGRAIDHHPALRLADCPAPGLAAEAAAQTFPRALVHR